MPEVQSPVYPATRGNTHRDASCDREDRISEIEAYQEETERYENVEDRYYKQEEDESPQVRGTEMSDDAGDIGDEQEQEFINNLTGYIQSLEKQTRKKTSSMHLKKTPVQSRREKENTIDLDLNRDKLGTL